MGSLKTGEFSSKVKTPQLSAYYVYGSVLGIGQAWRYKWVMLPGLMGFKER